MNVLHINQADISGGAAIAAYRLHQGLLTQNVDSRMLVSSVNISSNRIAHVPRKERVESLIARFSNRLGLNYLEFAGSFKIPKHPFYQDADVLNLHNLHTGTFNYLSIPTLTSNKPTVFTLHDMWGFTGHCAYSYDCKRWQTGCGQCPYPNSYPEIRMDNTRLEWLLKDWVYSRANLTIVTPSNWLAKQAEQSLLGRFPVHHIPYGVDVDAYQPLDANQCRSILGIPPDKNVLMVAAHSLTDPRKGGDVLLGALASLPLPLKAKTVILTLGAGGELIAEATGIAEFNLGYVGSDRLKAIAYSAADVFVLPTLADNLPLVLQESLACGTPIVSFKVGGVPDLVRPDITGYLAEPGSAIDLTNVISKLLEDPILREHLSQQCRQIAVKEYALTLQAERYIELYGQLLKEFNE